MVAQEAYLTHLRARDRIDEGFSDEGFLMRVPTLHCVQAHEGPALENLPRTKARGSW